MRKLYSLLLCTLLTVIGFSANAFTITIKADPELIETIQVGSSADIIDSKCIREFSVEGTLNTFDFTGPYIYVQVVPKANVKYTAVSTNADGSKSANISMLVNKKTTSKGSISVATYDGGTVEVDASKYEMASFTLNLSGSKDKLKMMIGTSRKYPGLGTTSYECETTDYVRLIPVGVEKFYKVLLNDTPKNIIDNMGSLEYSFTGLKTGDVITVETDYPDVKRDVSISINHKEAIKSFTVDGVETDWETTQAVQAGSIVRVELDVNNNIINKTEDGKNKAYLNGELIPNFYTAYSTVVDETDLAFEFEVTPIVRDKQFTLKVDPTLTAAYRIANNSMFTLDQGCDTVIKYGDLELPISIDTESTSSSTSDTRVRFAYINDVLVDHDFSSLKLTNDNLKDGDVVFIDFQKPYITVVSAVADHDKFVTELYGSQVTLDSDSTQFYMKDEQDVDSIKFYGVGNYRVDAVLVNGVRAEGVDGVFGFKPKNLTVYEVLVSYVPANFTINVNDAAHLMFGGAIYGDELIALEDGENQIDLNNYTEQSEELLILAPVRDTQYRFASLKYNGKEFITSDDVEQSYGFSFMPKVGDVIDVEIIKVPRNNEALVYVCGLDSVINFYIADVIGENKMIDKVVDKAYNVVNFNKYDLPMLVCWDKLLGENTAPYAYINDESIEFQRGADLSVANGDIVKIFFANEAPQALNLKFNVIGSENSPVVVVDSIVTVNFAAEAAPAAIAAKEAAQGTLFSKTVLPGTMMQFSAPGSDTYNDIVVNGEKIENAESGIYKYTVDADMTIDIYANDAKYETTAISGISTEAGATVIYNLQGIKVNGDNLPAGVYIINGKKVRK